MLNIKQSNYQTRTEIEYIQKVSINFKDLLMTLQLPSPHSLSYINTYSKVKN